MEEWNCFLLLSVYKDGHWLLYNMRGFFFVFIVDFAPVYDYINGLPLLAIVWMNHVFHVYLLVIVVSHSIEENVLLLLDLYLWLKRVIGIILHLNRSKSYSTGFISVCIALVIPIFTAFVQGYSRNLKSDMLGSFKIISWLGYIVTG